MSTQQRNRSRVPSLCAVIVTFSGLIAAAATPPTLVNYQGVLRDQNDGPLTGSYDMLFRFMDAATAGNEIMTDQHAAISGNAVTVSAGLFDTQLGSGTVTDGTGPSTYLSLDAVFRDYSNVWLEIRVGGETLSPRTKVQATAYALNATSATQLNGQPSSNFIDTSATTQTKAGKLSASLLTASTSAPSASAISGTSTGSFGSGLFGNGAAYGVWGIGDSAGYFQGTTNGVVGQATGGVGGAAGAFDTDSASTYGVFASSAGTAGHFVSTNSYAPIADLAFANVGVGGSCYAFGGIGVSGEGEQVGVQGSATGAISNGAIGGRFSAAGNNSIGIQASGTTGAKFSSNTGVGLSVDLASPSAAVRATGGSTWAGYLSTSAAGSIGIEASGNSQGGKFSNAFGESVKLADSAGDAGVDATGGTFGIKATGGTTGGFFSSSGAGRANVASGDTGVSASGASIGAYLSNGSPWFSYAQVPSSDFGIEAWGSSGGGSFRNFSNGNYARVGYSSYKIQGLGAVSFVQNHPTDSTKVIVYAAPEGDEVAVYTRGSARLVNGEARIELGETFALVANPDVGLTANVTPLGEATSLFVVDKSTRELVVRGPSGSNAAFDYAVWGLRIGFEEQSIVQPKLEDARIPSMHQHEQFFENNPALRNQTALARFQAIDAQVLGRRSLDLSRATSLREAIGSFEYQQPPTALQPMSGDSSPAPSAHPVADAKANVPAAKAGEFAASSRRTDAAAPTLPTATALPLASLVFEVSEPVDAGDLLVLDPLSSGALRRAASANDPNVAGIAEHASLSADGIESVNVVTTNYAMVKVDTQYGAIRPGDLLVSSPTPGHAMASIAPTAGTVIGKALQALDTGSGSIRVLLGAR